MGDERKSLPVVRGRGAAENPPNRFEPLAYEPDADEGASERGPATQYFRDSARSIVATNDSPDVGFDASVNPYRGCEHGCAYCLSGDTPILMGDGTTKPLSDVRVGDEIYGTERVGWYRRYVRTRVLAHWSVVKSAFRVTLADGTRLVAGGDHRFLTERGWKYVSGRHADGEDRPSLAANDELMGSGVSARPPADGQTLESTADLRVVSVEALGHDLQLFDITTGTEDFVANGVVSHNCYARPTHEFLGFSAGLDFETKILVKEDAPALLRRELASPRWTPKVIAMSGVTDAYQPVERKLGLTRRCLEVLAEFRNPVAIITKNALVARDADLLAELAGDDAAMVFLSMTTLDADLARALEPRASTPDLRLGAIEALARAGVPVGVLASPMIPGLTDHELPAILAAAAAAGARFAGFQPVRLPLGVADLFAAWLDRHAPARKEKVLNRIRATRGGALNDSRFGKRMTGEGVFAEQMRALFAVGCKKAGLARQSPALSTAAFRRPATGEDERQLSLFG